MPRALSIGIALTIAGCCVTPTPPPPPPSPCGSGPCARDAGPPADAPFTPPPFDLCTSPGFASGCADGCSGGLACFRERRTTAPATRSVDGGAGPEDAGMPDAAGADGGGVAPALEVVAFPGGLCSVPCASDAECGDCATCVPHVLAGRARLRGAVGGSGVCRPSCSPDVPGTCAAGYACDPLTSACLEACTTTEQCWFRTEDVDGDGDDDVLVYEPDPDVSCSPATGRCEAPPEPFGGPCSDATDCEAGYLCPVPRGGGPGTCALACDLDPSVCGDAARCAPSVTDLRRMCATRCTVGAEAPDDVTGSEGRGAGCPQAFQCVWDRVGPEPSGVCIPGVYNDVPAPNTGAPCVDDGDCWSPYGRGRCLVPHPHSSQGICVVTDCVPEGAGPPGLVPGVPVADLVAFCDPASGLTCVPQASLASESACLDACTSADECLPGWACTRVLGTEQRVCAPQCERDDDCTTGGRCQYPDTAPCGPRPGACFCR